MKFLLLLFAALLTGCDAQLGSNAATQSELASINQNVAALDARMSTVEQTVKRQSSGDWILWQVNGTAYPQALSGYSTKRECLAAAAAWTFPGGKQVSQDPDIFQLKNYRVSMECLPIGVRPYDH